jgi:predicted enzyme related to lactoylglutathione lyase
MTSLPPATGRFCWVDLASSDAERASAFYRGLFGWTPRPEAALGGRFLRLQLGGTDVGSLYQLQRAQLERGVPSHWTPYVQVEDLQAAIRRVAPLGGEVLVRPLEIPGIARIAIVADPAGAHFGLWQASRRG